MKEQFIPLFIPLEMGQYDTIMRLMHRHLPEMIDVDISVITLLALHSISLNRTIASHLVPSVPDYIRHYYPQYAGVEVAKIEETTYRVVEQLYGLFITTVQQFMLPLPAKVSQVKLTPQVLQVLMSCYVEENPCNYPYLISDSSLP